MEIAQLVKTRLVLAFPMAVCGALYLTHLTGWSQMNHGALPGNPSLWALLSGLALLAGAMAIALRRFDRQAALGVALLLTMFAAAVYAPCIGEGDVSMRFSSVLNLFKDMVLAGGSLAYAGLTSAKL